MNSDLDIWWNAYLASLASGSEYVVAEANYALENYKRKAAELEAEDGQ